MRADLLGLGDLPAHPRPPPARSSRSAQLQREFKPIIRRYAGKSPRYKYCRGMARNLLKAWPALWTFARHPGVEPTNNHAERALRSAVIYRKLSLGSQSAAGEQRVARLLSARTPPADSSTGRYTPTSPTPSPPTTAATQCPYSPETRALNAYENRVVYRAFAMEPGGIEPATSCLQRWHVEGLLCSSVDSPRRCSNRGA